MKLIIGLAFLSVAWAIAPIQLPEPALPAFEEVEEPQVEGVQVVDLPAFQVPDISPTLLSPEISAMLNEHGEIQPELLYDHMDNAPESVQFQTPDISPALVPPEISSMLNNLGEIRIAGILLIAEPVDTVQFVDAPLEAEYDSAPVDAVQVVDIVPEAESVDAVQVVDAPLEAEYDSAPVSAVLVADIAEIAPEAENVDAVKFVDAPLEAEYDSAPTDAVKVADIVPEAENVDAVQDSLLEAKQEFDDTFPPFIFPESEPVSAVKVADIAPIAPEAENVDAVQFVDAPLEAEYDSAAVEAVQVADIAAIVPEEEQVLAVAEPVVIEDAPLEDARLDDAPSKIGRLISKLIQARNNDIAARG